MHIIYHNYDNMSGSWGVLFDDLLNHYFCSCKCGFRMNELKDKIQDWDQQFIFWVDCAAIMCWSCLLHGNPVRTNCNLHWMYSQWMSVDILCKQQFNFKHLKRTCWRRETRGYCGIKGIKVQDSVFATEPRRLNKFQVTSDSTKALLTWGLLHTAVTFGGKPLLETPESLTPTDCMSGIQGRVAQTQRCIVSFRYIVRFSFGRPSKMLGLSIVHWSHQHINH